MKLLFARMSAALITAIVIVVAGAIPVSAAQQDDVVSLTNSHRSAAGLPPLTRDRTLDTAAQQWAEEMSRTGVFTHSSNEWRAARLPAGWTTHGENIAYGYGSPATVMAGWMLSAGHKQNILRSSFTRIGVGYVASGNFWVQIFAGYPVAPPSPAPIGTLEGASIVLNEVGGTLSVGGWAIDGRNASAPIPVHIYIRDPFGVQAGHALVADAARPDVGAAYPAAGAQHGFGATFPVTKSGTYQVCVYAIGSNGINPSLGCRTANFGPTDPIGSLDQAGIEFVGGVATLTASGWALDGAARSAPTQAHVYVTDPAGRTAGHALAANNERPDIANAFAGAGAAHGYSFSSAVTMPGTYTVCAYSIAAQVFGAGHRRLGCTTTRLGPTAPLGSFEAASMAADGTALTGSGWALDNGLRSVSTDAHVYVTSPAGRMQSYAVPATSARNDIARAFPGAGEAHGFAFQIPVTDAGSYRVCVYSLAAPALAPGNVPLPCRTVVKP